ncbi:MAG: CBS domain-containing protein, partial [Myxococcales bacterium]
LRDRCWSPDPVHHWPLAETERPRAMPTVASLMRTEFPALAPHAPLELAEALLQWSEESHLAVEHAWGELVGLLSARDIARWRAANPSHLHPDVSRLLAGPPPLIAPTATADEALQTMERLDVGCLAIVRTGMLAGLVYEDDVRRALEEFEADAPPDGSDGVHAHHGG